MKKIETDIEIYAEKIRKPMTLPSFKAYKLDLVEKHWGRTCKSEKFLLNFETRNLIKIFLQSKTLNRYSIKTVMMIVMLMNDNDDDTAA